MRICALTSVHAADARPETRLHPKAVPAKIVPATRSPLGRRAHYYNLQALPPPAFIAKFTNYSNLEPSFITFDLSLGYNTRTRPANDYLKNLDIHLIGNNITDRKPPFAYQVATNGGNPATFLIGLSPLGRVLTVVITKSW